MEQLILHLVGDYITQSDWMANNKTKRHWPALVHAFIYSLPFALLTSNPVAWMVIFVTHFVIDRYRLARFVVYFKNVVLMPDAGERDDECLGSDGRQWPTFPAQGCECDYCRHWREYTWENCKETGYPSQRPAWLAVWLLIAADNTLHLAINYCALRWL